MSTAIQRRRGTTAEHSSFAGLAAEITVDTSKNTVVVHNGSTAGGFPLLRENGSQNLVTTGTATAASFIPTSSTAPTNGVYLPAANSVALATNGSGRLFVDASGNVLVGNATSGSALVELQADGDIFFKRLLSRVSSGECNIYFNSGDNSQSKIWLGGNTNFGHGQIIYDDASDYLSFVANNQERLRITSTGTVNIVGAGTVGSTQAISFNGSAPVNSLVVDSSGRVGVGTSAPAETLQLGQNGSGTDNYIAIWGDQSGSNAEFAGLKFFNNQANSSSNPSKQVASLYAARDGDNFGGALYFQTANPSSGSQTLGTRMVLDSSGRLGIGTTSPSQALTVNSGSISISNRGSGNAYLLPDWRIYNSSSGNALVFDNYTTEALRVDSSNRLLVGTASNSGGALLQVNGDRIRVGTAKTPASATDTGTAGEICWDANYIYVCTATNTWKRTAIATW